MKTWLKNRFQLNQQCKHCWHVFTGAIWIVLRAGQHIEQCCHCGENRVVCTREQHGPFLGKE